MKEDLINQEPQSFSLQKQLYLNPILGGQFEMAPGVSLPWRRGGQFTWFFQDVIMNITGNIISGQVMGDTAKQLSERFGKIMQDRESVSINRTDTSVSRSSQLDYAIPASKITSLSSGKFVGIIADDPHEKIKLKMFHAEIMNDAEKLSNEANNFKEIPVISDVTHEQVMENYRQVKLDIKRIISEEVSRLMEEKELETNGNA